MKRVLSIQSHVVYGYVGSKAATFPLQLYSIDVDCIFTVQFSNHTQYPIVKGEKLEADTLREITQGLCANGILPIYSHILTGYIGSDLLVEAVAELVERMKKVNPKITFLLDPVMGDEGKLYVPEESVQLYQHRLLKFADIITPNAYEAELLTGIRVANIKSAVECLDWLHEHSSAKYIVITSASLIPVNNDITSNLHNDTEFLHLIASFKDSNKAQRFTITFPKLTVDSGTFTGTGDLFAAMMIAHLSLTATFQEFVKACEKCIAVLQAVLKATVKNFDQASKDCLDEIQLMRARELALISSRTHIENPDIIYRAQLL